MAKIKYPFSPAFLDAAPEPIAELFRGLELTLLDEICSRLRAAGELNEVTVDSIRALRAHGIELDDIKQAIQDTAEVSEKELNKLLDDVVERNKGFYEKLFDIAQITAPPVLVDENDIEIIREQALGEFRNITRSMGFLVNDGKTLLPPAAAYQHCLDSAALQIQSGAISYNQAIANATRELANSGLVVWRDDDGNYYRNRVRYEQKTGKKPRAEQLDVCCRRAILTSINQLNQKYREQSMDYLETDLIEVTAHLGARNTLRPGDPDWVAHTTFQGKVFRWNKRKQQQIRLNINDMPQRSVTRVKLRG